MQGNLWSRWTRALLAASAVAALALAPPAVANDDDDDEDTRITVLRRDGRREVRILPRDRHRIVIDRDAIREAVRDARRGALEARRSARMALREARRGMRHVRVLRDDRAADFRDELRMLRRELRELEERLELESQ